MPSEYEEEETAATIDEAAFEDEETLDDEEDLLTVADDFAEEDADAF